MLSFALLAMLASAINFDRSAVKHALQNIQNDCHQWLSLSALNSFSAGGLPRTPLGELTQIPSWFKGLLLLRGWGGENRKGGGEKRERDRRGNREGG